MIRLLKKRSNLLLLEPNQVLMIFQQSFSKFLTVFAVNQRLLKNLLRQRSILVKLVSQLKSSSLKLMTACVHTISLESLITSSVLEKMMTNGFFLQHLKESWKQLKPRRLYLKKQEKHLSRKWNRNKKSLKSNSIPLK